MPRFATLVGRNVVSRLSTERVTRGTAHDHANDLTVNIEYPRARITGVRESRPVMAYDNPINTRLAVMLGLIEQREEVRRDVAECRACPLANLADHAAVYIGRLNDAVTRADQVECEKRFRRIGKRRDLSSVRKIPFRILVSKDRNLRPT